MSEPTIDRDTAREALTFAMRRGAFGLVWMTGALCLMASGPFTPWAEWESRLIKLGTLAVLFCVLISMVYSLAPLLSLLAERLLKAWLPEDHSTDPTEENVHHQSHSHPRGKSR